MWRADVALVGFGNVARRFALLLEERRERLLRDHQLDCRIVAIATARHGSIVAERGIDSSQAAADRSAGRTLGSAGTAFQIIRQLAQSDAPLRVMVETTTLSIEDGEPAISHVEAALEAGCHAVTANKGPASFAYRRLSDLAQRRGVSFLFEGAVMDGVPIFNMVRETMPAVKVIGFRGIVNTTTQHILTALEGGQRFDDALARMQAEGIAEADPSLDLDGWDAAAKAAALANVLMGAELTPHAVEREAVRPDTAAAAQRAMAAGLRLRLVASATATAAGVRPSVRLTELGAGEMLATLPGTANALVLTTDLLGDVAICQMGGDLTQTAYALLSDLITIRRRVPTEARA